MTEDDGPLSGIDLLADMPADERRMLARRCSWTTVPKGQTVFVKESPNRDGLALLATRLENGP